MLDWAVPDLARCAQRAAAADADRGGGAGRAITVDQRALSDLQGLCPPALQLGHGGNGSVHRLWQVRAEAALRPNAGRVIEIARHQSRSAGRLSRLSSISPRTGPSSRVTANPSLVSAPIMDPTSRSARIMSNDENAAKDR